MRGKWAAGIAPRYFAWVIKDRLAISERPGGYARNHRKVRRQEEIIWIREQGFGMVVSIIPSTHNLHNYEELGVAYLHRPFGATDEPRQVLTQLYPELQKLLADNTKVLLHGEEVGDRVAGLIGGYIRWAGMVPGGPESISIVERITGRQLDPFGRSLITMAPELPHDPAAY